MKKKMKKIVYIYCCCCCCCSIAQLRPTLCNPMDCSMPGLSVPHHLLQFAQVHIHCISDGIHPLMPSSLCTLSFPASGTFLMSRPFASDSISPSREHSGVISLKIDWFDVPAVQGTFRSLLQHHNRKA